MSALSDRIKKTIQSVFDLPRKDIEVRVDAIVAATRQGQSQGQQVKDILQTIEDAETAVKTVQGLVKTADSVLKSLNAASKIAEASEKAAAITAANPATAASAAVAIVQRSLREKVEKEIEEGKDALNVTPNLIQNFNKFVTDTRNKLKKIKAEQEKKNASLVVFPITPSKHAVLADGLNYLEDVSHYYTIPQSVYSKFSSRIVNYLALAISTIDIDEMPVTRITRASTSTVSSSTGNSTLDDILKMIDEGDFGE